MFFGEKRWKKAWSYIIETPAVNLAVNLVDMKAWLKVTSSSQDDIIIELIEAATLVGEKYTKRDFIIKTYKTFRNSFSDDAEAFGIREEMVMRRSRLDSVGSVSYLKDSILTPVDSSVFYATQEVDYSHLIPLPGQQWPVGAVDDRQQAVEIIFDAGFGADESFVPEDIKTAIKLHVAAVFANRGDCNDKTLMPARTAAIYGANRILDITLS